MPIEHKFLNCEFGNGFSTVNGILQTPYKPQVMVIGTFNPKLESNRADFFYGRNFFWTALKNIFVYKSVELFGERLEYCPYNPTLEEIQVLCGNLKFTFTDLIHSINDKNNEIFIETRSGKEYLQINGITYNPIKDGDLLKLDIIHKIDWNTTNIVNYLRNIKSVKRIIFTRNDDGRWNRQISEIKRNFPEIEVISIYTPSAQGGALHQQTGIYGQGKMKPLIVHWLSHRMFDIDFLNQRNVNPDNF